MKKILLQALVEGEESSVKCEANNVTGTELLAAFSHICEAMLATGATPSLLKAAVDFAESQLDEQDIE